MRAEARLKNLTVHFARMFELCHEKGSELADGDPENKMKGRAVLLGDNVRDQDFNWAELCELGSSPPSLEAANARGAYTQSLLKGVETWVRLPDTRWPKLWMN